MDIIAHGRHHILLLAKHPPKMSEFRFDHEVLFLLPLNL